MTRPSRVAEQNPEIPVTSYSNPAQTNTLPRDSSRRPFTPRGAALITQVAELIDPATDSWDVQLVKDLFWEEDAQLILALPTHGARANSLAWHFDKHGVFSVKSAYKVSWEDANRRASQQCSSVQGEDSVWKKLWKLKNPSKVKHFLWRLTHNSHPLRCNLFRKGMQIDISCPVCSRMSEDGAHLFFKCKQAKQVWRLLGFEKEREVLADIPTALGAVEWIMQQQEMRKELIITTLWFLWSERNCIREEGRRRPAEAIVRSIELFFNENVQPPRGAVHQLRGSRRRWTKPPDEVLKLNVDGSFLPNENSGSWGFLIRDSEGDVVMSGRGRIDHLLSAFHAELVACMKAIQTAADLGISKVILETNAQEVVRALNSTAYDDATVGHLATEIKFLVGVNFTSFVCLFIPRDCNKAAHELASLGRVCGTGEENLSALLPDSINVIVANESLADE